MKITIPIQQFVVHLACRGHPRIQRSGALTATLTVDYQVLTIQNGLIYDDVDCIATMTSVY